MIYARCTREPQPLAVMQQKQTRPRRNVLWESGVLYTRANHRPRPKTPSFQSAPAAAVPLFPVPSRCCVLLMPL